MADEEDPWGFDDGGEEEKAASSTQASNQGTPAPPSKAPSVASDHKADSVVAGTPANEEAAPEEIEEIKAPPPPPEDDGYRKPVQLYRHWVRLVFLQLIGIEYIFQSYAIFCTCRPKFLQYKYMYNYRTNYYDDVIDYIDKKQTGVTREIPRPQTWAERVLRTRNIR